MEPRPNARSAAKLRIWTDSTEVIWTHESQPVEFCQSCFRKLAAEERVGFAMTRMRERAAWYARYPEFCRDPEAVYMGD